MAESNLLVEKRKEYAAKATKFGELLELVKSPDDYGKKEVQEKLGASDADGAKSAMHALGAECQALGKDVDALTLEEMKGVHKLRLESLNKPIRDTIPGSSKADEPLSFGGLITSAKDWAGRKMAVGATFEVDMGDAGLKTLLQTSAGWQPRTGNGTVLVDKVIRPVQVLDVFPADRTDLFEIPSMEETTRTQAAAELAEAGTYQEDAFAFTRRTSPVRKIGSEIPVTDEQLDDVPTMRALLDNRLSFGVRARLDQQVIVGDGTGSNLTGLFSASGIQTQAKGSDSGLNALYKALVLVRITGRAVPDTYFLHGTDWQNIRLSQNANGDYFYGPPSTAGDQMLWGLPVVQTEALTQSNALVGAVRQFSQIWYRKDVEIQVGFINDQFIKGQKTLRGDLRAALWIGRGAAFCKVTGL